MNPFAASKYLLKGLAMWAVLGGLAASASPFLPTDDSQVLERLRSKP